MESQIEAFINEAEDGTESIAFLIRQSSVVEYDDELVPGCLLSANQARFLAEGLVIFANAIDPLDGR